MRFMKFKYFVLLYVLFFVTGCTQQQQQKQDNTNADFQWQTEEFADIRILRYQVPGWDQLTTDQKKLVYYLTQAGLEGRDIMYDQNYRYNLQIREALENIYTSYQGDKTTDEWKKFEIYLKRIWFSNGIHHHYSTAKIMPDFPKAYFQTLLNDTGTTLDGNIINIMFDPTIDAKKINLDDSKDLLLNSAVNFYAPDVSQKEVEEFYDKKMDKNDPTPISYGLNSRIAKNEQNKLYEQVYKVDGLYGPAIEKIINWLEKAVTVSENKPQADALKLLIEYYKTGDLETWDDYNIAWVKATEGDIDYINGFVEVYNDPMGYRGSYETIVEIKDFDASERMKVLMENAQWFEDNAPIIDDHKKEKVVGITYKVVNVAGEAGDASPSTPIGVNLPNANWIRAEYGSKSVSLGNITDAYEQASGNSYTNEFALTEKEKERAEKYASLGDKLHTALHEVIGHASGKLNPGVGTPKETLKNYASALEEARADLVALYYLYDQKLVDIGLMPSLEVGKAAYDDYIRNGLMIQLRRIKTGEDIEQAHMRNRQLVAKWVYEKGKPDNVIKEVKKDGKTYYTINDYDKLKALFGELLKKVQKVKSEGNFAAAKELIETYGVKVDPEIHKEVLARTEKLDVAPYSGFINPQLIPVMEGDEIVDIKVMYPDDFAEQMLHYSSEYHNLKTSPTVIN